MRPKKDKFPGKLWIILWTIFLKKEYIITSKYIYFILLLEIIHKFQGVLAPLSESWCVCIVPGRILFSFQTVSKTSNYVEFDTFAHSRPVLPLRRKCSNCLTCREIPPERAFLGALAGFVPEGEIMRRQGSICAWWSNGSPLWGYLRGRAEGVGISSKVGCGPIKRA